ncbi:hypothetical protein niasHT_022203 [Heterodera trifolii]|uniref:Uncharacterized protein n=1 Tax=Heterodera trifolii TaxID=157864 RepID=A0ABD2JNN8_9BILA
MRSNVANNKQTIGQQQQQQIDEEIPAGGESPPPLPNPSMSCANTPGTKQHTHPSTADCFCVCYGPMCGGRDARSAAGISSADHLLIIQSIVFVRRRRRRRLSGERTSGVCCMDTAVCSKQANPKRQMVYTVAAPSAFGGGRFVWGGSDWERREHRVCVLAADDLITPRPVHHF